MTRNAGQGDAGPGPKTTALKATRGRRRTAALSVTLCGALALGTAGTTLAASGTATAATAPETIAVPTATASNGFITSVVAIGKDLGTQTGLSFAGKVLGGVFDEISAQLFGVPETVSEERSKKTLERLERASKDVSEVAAKIDALQDRVVDLSCAVNSGNALKAVVRVETAGNQYQRLLETMTETDDHDEVQVVGERFQRLARKIAKPLNGLDDQLLDDKGANSSLISICGQRIQQRYQDETVGDSDYFRAFHQWLGYFTSSQALGTFYRITAETMAIAASEDFQRFIEPPAGNSDDLSPRGFGAEISDYCDSAKLPEVNDERCRTITTAYRRVSDAIERELLAVGLPYSRAGKTRAQRVDDRLLVWADDLWAFSHTGCPEDVTTVSFAPGGHVCGATAGRPGETWTKSTYSKLDGWGPATRSQLRTLVAALPQAGDSTTMTDPTGRGRIGERMRKAGFGRSFERTIIYAEDGRIDRRSDPNVFGQVNCDGALNWRTCPPAWAFMDTWMPLKYEWETRFYGTCTGARCHNSGTDTAPQTMFDRGEVGSAANALRRGWAGYQDPKAVVKGPIQNFLARPSFYMYQKDLDSGAPLNSSVFMKPEYIKDNADQLPEAFRFPVAETAAPSCARGRYAGENYGRGTNKVKHLSLCGEPLEAAMTEMLSTIDDAGKARP